MSTPSPRISSISDPRRVIHNPLTGEVATFTESSSRRCVFELVLPPGTPAVPVHSHPGREGFRTVQGHCVCWSTARSTIRPSGPNGR